MGKALTAGVDYDRIINWFITHRGIDYRPRAHGGVLITVTAVEPLISPAYADGSSDEQIADLWRNHYRIG